MRLVLGCWLGVAVGCGPAVDDAAPSGIEASSSSSSSSSTSGIGDDTGSTSHDSSTGTAGSDESPQESTSDDSGGSSEETGTASVCEPQPAGAIATTLYDDRDIRWFDVPFELELSCEVESASHSDGFIVVELRCDGVAHSVAVASDRAMPPIRVGESVDLKVAAHGFDEPYDNYLALARDGTLLLGAGSCDGVVAPSGRFPETEVFAPLVVSPVHDLCEPEPVADPCVTFRRAGIRFALGETAATIIDGHESVVGSYAIAVEAAVDHLEPHCVHSSAGRFNFSIVAQ